MYSKCIPRILFHQVNLWIKSLRSNSVSHYENQLILNYAFQNVAKNFTPGFIQTTVCVLYLHSDNQRDDVPV